jgi:hypothetical protein
MPADEGRRLPVHSGLRQHADKEHNQPQNIAARGWRLSIKAAFVFSPDI